MLLIHIGAYATTGNSANHGAGNRAFFTATHLLADNGAGYSANGRTCFGTLVRIIGGAGCQAQRRADNQALFNVHDLLLLRFELRRRDLDARLRSPLSALPASASSKSIFLSSRLTRTTLTCTTSDK